MHSLYAGFENQIFIKQHKVLLSWKDIVAVWLRKVFVGELRPIRQFSQSGGVCVTGIGIG